MEDDSFKIRLRPFNMIIPLTVSRSEEKLYRDAERKLNYIYGRYKEQLLGYDEKELMAIVALTFACKVMKHEDSNDTRPFAEAMEQAIVRMEEKLKTDSF